MLGQGGGDRRRQGLDLGDERAQDRDEAADELATGHALRVADAAEGRRAQAGEQLGGRPAPGVGVVAEELRQAALAQALGALRSGVTGEERQGDRRVDVGEDRGGAGPDALEEGAKLIGKGDALRDEVVAAPHQRAERPGLIGERLSGAEAVAIGAEEVGEELAGRRRPHQPEASVPRTNVACGFPALRSTGRLPA